MSNCMSEILSSPSGSEQEEQVISKKSKSTKIIMKIEVFRCMFPIHKNSTSISVEMEMSLDDLYAMASEISDAPLRITHCFDDMMNVTFSKSS